MEVLGKVRYIGPEMQVSATFKKRELVVTTDEQYPQHISINFLQDKTELLDRFAVNDEVKVGINLRGREWINPQGEAKYFNDIQGWKVEAMNETSGKHKPSSQASTPATEAPFNPNAEEEDSDNLPF